MERLIIAYALFACTHAAQPLLSTVTASPGAAADSPVTAAASPVTATASPVNATVAPVIATATDSAPASPDTTSNSPVTFITVETRGHPWLGKIGHFPEPIINVANGMAWPHIGVYRLKVQLLSKWLQTQPASKLIAFVDGDVFWGGCSLKDFVGAYNDIVRQTGAKIVFGAELGCIDQDCTKVPDVPQYARWRTRDWAQYTKCPATWDEECAKQKSCHACSNPPAPMFLNPGFIMGPAGYLFKMTLVAQSRFNQWASASDGDQGVFAEYWLQNPRDVTLDYETKLVMSLSYMAPNVTDVDTSTGAIINKARNQAQCFVHGNGPAKAFAKKIAMDLGVDTSKMQVKGTWPPAMLQKKASISAAGELVGSSQHDTQLTRRMARRHEPSVSATEKVEYLAERQSEAHPLHLLAHEARSDETARRMWNGK